MAKQCPVTADKFSASAKPVIVTVNGHPMTAYVKEPEPGKSLGWYLSGKVDIDVGGVQVPVQIGMNITCIGSKEK